MRILSAILMIVMLGSCTSRHRTLPIANAFTPEGPVSGMVSIRYVLKDRTSTRLTINVDYRTRPAMDWTTATSGPGGEGKDQLRASPGGVNHEFQWDSHADLGPRSFRRVQIRITPRFKGAKGSRSRTAEFHVDNTGGFVGEGSPPLSFRDRHTVTLMDGGRVLVAGGVDALGVPLDTAEVYNPWDGSYSPVPVAMNAARERHVAVGLGDGRVLLAGGVGLVDAEVFLPEPATFTSALGTLGVARREMTATLLGDGTVLLAGGFDGLVAVGNAEIFTPGSPGTGGTLAATAAMALARRGHFAVRLQSGGVLIGGGADNLGAPETGEIYDPGAGTFAATAATMAEVRYHGSAALLGDGTVAILGGRDGIPGGVLVPTGEIYIPDPLTPLVPTLDQFAPVPSLPPPPTVRELAAGHSVPGGNAVFLGGSDGASGVLVADLYLLHPYDDDPATSTCPDPDAFCQSPGAMASARLRPVTAVLPDDKIYVAGGTGNPEIYVPPSLGGGETFVNATDLPEARAEHTMTTLPGGQVLVAGGEDLLLATLDTAIRYDAAQETYVTAGTMISPRQGHTATALPDGRVLVVGGRNGGTPLGSREIYDPWTDAFTSLAGALTDDRYDHTATLLPDGSVLVVGGTGASGPLATAEIIDPTLAVGGAGSLQVARTGQAAVRMQNGNVLIIGGVDGGGAAIDLVETYELWTGLWPAGLQASGVERSMLGAALLPDGRVMAMGGVDALGETVQTTDIYDPFVLPGQIVVTPGPEMERLHADFTLAPLPDGRILVAGGINASEVFPKSEVYEFGRGTFQDTLGNNLRRERRGAPAAVLPDGRVFIAGGRNNAGEPLLRAEIFDP